MTGILELCAMSSDSQTDASAVQRQHMVDVQVRARGIRDERVLAAMERVPRHEFVGGKYRDQAYEDHPVPIDEGQTLSQPYIVALMLAALSLRPSDKVLEIGTGSGYQTALLCELAATVYSIERHTSLAAAAEFTLTRLGYSNYKILVGDGSEGLPETAPYNAIIVSAAAPRIPGPLFDQLAEDGRMVIPVGSPHAQELQLIRKQLGEQRASVMEGCRFVPLVGAYGYDMDW